MKGGVSPFWPSVPHFQSFDGLKVFVSPLKPGLHIVVMVVSTVANMFLTLFQAVLIHVNTLITISQA